MGAEEDGTIHLPVPVAWRHLPIRVRAEIEPENMATDIEFKERKISLRPRKNEGKSLSELLGRVTRTNLHRSVETGGAVGGESW